MTQKNISISERSRHNLLHIEAPGCIINIRVCLADNDGRPVTNVSIDADGDRYAGDPEWWINAERGNKGLGCRIVRTGPISDSTATTPTKPETRPRKLSRAEAAGLSRLLGPASAEHVAEFLGLSY